MPPQLFEIGALVCAMMLIGSLIALAAWAMARLTRPTSKPAPNASTNQTKPRLDALRQKHMFDCLKTRDIHVEALWLPEDGRLRVIGMADGRVGLYACAKYPIVDLYLVHWLDTPHSVLRTLRDAGPKIQIDLADLTTTPTPKA